MAGSEKVKWHWHAVKHNLNGKIKSVNPKGKWEGKVQLRDGQEFEDPANKWVYFNKDSAGGASRDYAQMYKMSLGVKIRTVFPSLICWRTDKGTSGDE